MKTLKFAVTFALPLGLLAGVGLGLAQPAAADPIYVYGRPADVIVQTNYKNWKHSRRAVETRNQAIYRTPVQAPVQTVIIPGRGPVLVQEIRRPLEREDRREERREGREERREDRREERREERYESNRYPVVAYPGHHHGNTVRPDWRYESNQRPVIAYPVRPTSHRVWIAGHYEPGFLGLGRKWVEGHWETRN
jgi:hypothetical protein